MIALWIRIRNNRTKKKLYFDTVIYGTSRCFVKPNGLIKRIDPLDLYKKEATKG